MKHYQYKYYTFLFKDKNSFEKTAKTSKIFFLYYTRCYRTIFSCYSSNILYQHFYHCHCWSRLCNQFRKRP